MISELQLLLVLQTHSLGDAQKNSERFCKASKAEIMRRCTKSLIDSINYAVKNVQNFKFELVILDDHSDDESIEFLKNNLLDAQFPTRLIHLSTRGVMPSILACYEYGKNNGKDWVYFVQDDYLYEENAIADMLFVATSTSVKLNNYTCVFPYDDPYRYIPENTAILSHIIRECGRHWRTQIMTGSCFMVHHSVILKNWDLFEAMGKYDYVPEMEDKTINQLFRTRGYYLFVPLTSLALHMQGPTEYDPFIDYKRLWDKYELPNTSIIDKSIKSLLNVGFGGKTIKEDINAIDLQDFREITFDINNKLNPDIIGDIKNLTGIPTESFDCIYASHILEYVDINVAPLILKQFNRILKIDGFARIIVKNFQIVSMYLLQDKLFELIKDYLMPYNFLYIGNDFVKSIYTKQIFVKISEHYNLNLSIKEKDFDLEITLLKTI